MLAYIKYYVTVVKDSLVDEIQLVKTALLSKQDQIDSEIKVVEQETRKMEQETEEMVEEVEMEKGIGRNEQGTGNDAKEQLREKISQQVAKISSTVTPAPPLRNAADRNAKEVDGVCDAMQKSTVKQEDQLKKLFTSDLDDSLPQKEAIACKVSYDLTMDGNQNLLDCIFEALNVRQAELLRVMGEMKERLDQSVEKQFEAGSVLIATPKAGSPSQIPNERTFNQLLCPSSPTCCRTSPHVQVLTVAPPDREEKARPR